MKIVAFLITSLDDNNTPISGNNLEFVAIMDFRENLIEKQLIYARLQHFAKICKTNRKLLQKYFMQNLSNFGVWSGAKVCRS